MTTERHEIVVEGSNDGTDWRPYEFRWKPGDPAAAAVASSRRTSRASTGRCGSRRSGAASRTRGSSASSQRLLEGSPDVQALLANDPFAGRPPRYLRTMLYDYRFTDAAERRRTGAWWRRRALGPYGPVLERPGA